MVLPAQEIREMRVLLLSWSFSPPSALGHHPSTFFFFFDIHFILLKYSQFTMLY